MIRKRWQIYENQVESKTKFRKQKKEKTIAKPLNLGGIAAASRLTCGSLWIRDDIMALNVRPGRWFSPLAALIMLIADCD